ncbi:D-ribose pyranase [Coraliomargarita sinensis]|uniref:D-ribose pyranase n=1 Tax=Coraliomargarita sinensis TaxID=2174842 RepID=A0A317ZHI0_9BACT|nr:D-ribose pyranase [Coraliomargarita sinensis]PXA05016.1 D-ribose pyranase [Coraliomargarita sinensis]
MKEVGFLNGQVDAALARQGHMDLLMVVDAGFPVPDHVELIDLALKPDTPTVPEVLAELAKIHSVEKLVLAEETRQHNPTYFKNVTSGPWEGAEVEVIPHTELKVRSHEVKTIIRTGDFTAWANIMLVSGAGDRWKLEVPPKE